jgi:hypothetical protein
MKFWIFTFPATEGVGVITAWPDGGPDSYLYGEAQPLQASFPAGASVVLSHNFPSDRALVDFQPNTLGGVFVSAKARQIIEGLGLDNTEFLRVAIKDHKGRVVDDSCAILNLIGGEDAIDMTRSEYSMSPISKDQIITIDNLILQPEKIRPNAKLFRCSQRRRLILLRDDARKVFEKHGLTGYQLFEADGWDGLEV